MTTRMKPEHKLSVRSQTQKATFTRDAQNRDPQRQTADQGLLGVPSGGDCGRARGFSVLWKTG